MDLAPHHSPRIRDGGYVLPQPPDLTIGMETEEDKDDGWLLGFVDILTLLLTLFVLLLAFTQLPRHSDTHARSSTDSHQMTLTHSRGTPPVTPPPATQVPSAAQDIIIPADIRSLVQVTTSASDVNLVIKDDVLFDAGSDDLKPAGQSVLTGIAELLKRNDHPVSVEGHTDDTPIHTAQFPSNWELSAARATNVTRRLIRLGVDAGRLRAIGFADTQPLDSNATPEGRAHNRRVSLVIHLNETATKPHPRESKHINTVVTGRRSQASGH